MAAYFFRIIIEHLLGIALCGLLIAAASIVLAKKRLWFWAFLNHCGLSVSFRLRFRQNRIGLRLVTLDDYVALLDRLREKLNRFCQQKHLTIKIYVFTMQLPRDWPLWASSVRPASPEKTALEQYFFNFHQFLNAAKTSGRAVDVKRIIVIENCTSPLGKLRLTQLGEDASSSYFDKYIEMLHGNPTQALLWTHDRTWPGWLSDAVFYGVGGEGGSTDWLWGVTTSYRAGEDLLLLRFHRTSRRELDSRFIFPWGAKSLVQLLETSVSVEAQMIRLVDLRPAAVGSDPPRVVETTVSLPPPALATPPVVPRASTISSRSKPAKGKS